MGKKGKTKKFTGSKVDLGTFATLPAGANDTPAQQKSGAPVINHWKPQGHDAASARGEISGEQSSSYGSKNNPNSRFSQQRRPSYENLQSSPESKRKIEERAPEADWRGHNSSTDGASGNQRESNSEREQGHGYDRSDTKSGSKYKQQNEEHVSATDKHWRVTDANSEKEKFHGHDRTERRNSWRDPESKSNSEKEHGHESYNRNESKFSSSRPGERRDSFGRNGKFEYQNRSRDQDNRGTFDKNENGNYHDRQRRQLNNTRSDRPIRSTYIETSGNKSDDLDRSRKEDGYKLKERRSDHQYTSRDKDSIENEPHHDISTCESGHELKERKSGIQENRSENEYGVENMSTDENRSKKEHGHESKNRKSDRSDRSKCEDSSKIKSNDQKEHDLESKDRQSVRSDRSKYDRGKNRSNDQKEHDHESKGRKSYRSDRPRYEDNDQNRRGSHRFDSNDRNRIETTQIYRPGSFRKNEAMLNRQRHEGNSAWSSNRSGRESNPNRTWNERPDVQNVNMQKDQFTSRSSAAQESNYDNWNTPSQSESKSFFPHPYTENYKEFLDWRKMKDFSKTKCAIREKKGDLFSAPLDFSLCHCVAEDLSMGSGIAVAFKEKFKRIEELMDQRQKTGGLAILEDEGRFIYYLVTKKLSRGKPTNETLLESLLKMKEHMESHKVIKLAMPTIGCGLDRLIWEDVSQMIEFVFKDLEVQIVVYIFEQKDEADDTASKSERRSAKIMYREHPLVDIESETILTFIASIDHAPSDQIKDLDKKFYFLPDYQQDKNAKLGDNFYVTKKNETIVGLYVKEKENELISYKNFVSCLKKLNNYFKKSNLYCIGIEAFTEEEDDLMMSKITSLIRLYVASGFEVYICGRKLD